MTAAALRKENEILKRENESLRFKLLNKNANKRHSEYLREMDNDIAELKRVLEAKNNGIEPDPKLIAKLRNDLIEAGIFDKNGGLAEPYRREE